MNHLVTDATFKTSGYYKTFMFEVLKAVESTEITGVFVICVAGKSSTEIVFCDTGVKK